MEYLTAQRAVVAALAADVLSGGSYVASELDSMNFYPEAITNDHLRHMYCALIQAGNRGATSKDVILSILEQQYRTNGVDKVEPIIHQWEEKLDKIDPPSDFVQAARFVLNADIVRVVSEETKAFLSRLQKSADPIDELGSFSAYLNGITSLAGSRPAKMSEILRRAKEIRAVQTGLPWIDNNVFWNKNTNSGGLGEGTVTAWLAPSGHGKTSVGTTFAKNWVMKSRPVVYLTAEEPDVAMSLRLLAALSGLPPHIANAPSTHNEIEAVRAAHEIGDNNIFIYEIGGDIEPIEKIVRKHRLEFRDKPLLVILDHINALDPGTGTWSRDLENVMAKLKRLSTAQRAIVVVFAQVPDAMERELREQNFTTYSDARGSRAIRQWADYMVVSCMHNRKPGETVIQRIKNRYDIYRAVWGCFRFDTQIGILTADLTEERLGSTIKDLEAAA